MLTITSKYSKIEFHTLFPPINGFWFFLSHTLGQKFSPKITTMLKKNKNSEYNGSRF